nr:probable cyclin-dependent serine/threonine-protein kinase DDB_G0292550 [Lepeophtheirus salmonis]
MSSRVPFLPLLPTDKSRITLLRAKKIHDSRRLYHPLISEQLWIEKSQEYNSYIHEKLPKEIEFTPFDLNDVQNTDYIQNVRNHLEQKEDILNKTPEFPYISPPKTTMVEKLSDDTLEAFLPLIKMSKILTLSDRNAQTIIKLSENVCDNLEYYKVDPFSFIREDVCDVFLSLYELPDFLIEDDTYSNTLCEIQNDSITQLFSDLTDEFLLHNEIVDYVLLSNPEESNNSKEESVIMRDDNNNIPEIGVENNGSNSITFNCPTTKDNVPQDHCSNENPNHNNSSMTSLIDEDKPPKLKADVKSNSSNDTTSHSLKTTDNVLHSLCSVESLNHSTSSITSLIVEDQLQKLKTDVKNYNSNDTTTHFLKTTDYVPQSLCSVESLNHSNSSMTSCIVQDQLQKLKTDVKNHCSNDNISHFLKTTDNVSHSLCSDEDPNHINNSMASFIVEDLLQKLKTDVKNHYSNDTISHSLKTTDNVSQSLCSDENPNTPINSLIVEHHKKLKLNIDSPSSDPSAENSQSKTQFESTSLMKNETKANAKINNVFNKKEIIAKLPPNVSTMKETPKLVVASSNGGSNGLFISESMDEFNIKSRSNIAYKTEISNSHPEPLQISSSINHFLNESKDMDSSIDNEDILIKRANLNDDLTDENVLLLNENLIKDKSKSNNLLNTLEKEKLHLVQTSEISEQKDLHNSKKVDVDFNIKSVNERHQSFLHLSTTDEKSSSNIKLNLFRDEIEFKAVKNTDPIRANVNGVSKECEMSQASFLEGQSSAFVLNNTIPIQEMSYNFQLEKSLYTQSSKNVYSQTYEKLTEKTDQTAKENFTTKKENIDSNFRSIFTRNKYDTQPSRLKQDNSIHEGLVGCSKDVFSKHSNASLRINEINSILEKSKTVRHRLSGENRDIETVENKSIYFIKETKKTTTISTQSPYFQSKTSNNCPKNKRSYNITQAPFSLNTLKLMKRMRLAETSTNTEEKQNQIIHEEEKKSPHTSPIIGSKSKESEHEPEIQLKESSSTKRKMKRTKVIPNFNF